MKRAYRIKRAQCIKQAEVAYVPTYPIYPISRPKLWPKLWPICVLMRTPRASLDRPCHSIYIGLSPFHSISHGLSPLRWTFHATRVRYSHLTPCPQTRALKLHGRNATRFRQTSCVEVLRTRALKLEGCNALVSDKRLQESCVQGPGRVCLMSLPETSCV